MILGADTVTVLRGRTRDTRGDLQGTDTETVVSGCSFQPLGGVEQTDRGELIVSNATLFAPIDADIIATDRILWLGDTYVVNGPPKRWTVPGSEHIQAELKFTQGQA